MRGGREDGRGVLRKSMFHILSLYSETWRIAKIREDNDRQGIQKVLIK